MAHQWQQHWIKSILQVEYPECFKNVRVLDVGSLDINGTNKGYFEDSDYIGIDVIEGKNVDVVCPCHKYEPDEIFDVIISTNALEHDMYLNKTLKKMYELVKSGGYIFISASCGWGKHGTTDASPQHSGTSQIEEDGWCDYYKNVSWSDIKEAFNIEDMEPVWRDRRDGKQRVSGDSKLFEYYSLETSKRDIRFIGKKR